VSHVKVRVRLRVLRVMDRICNVSIKCRCVITVVITYAAVVYIGLALLQCAYLVPPRTKLMKYSGRPISVLYRVVLGFV